MGNSLHNKIYLGRRHMTFHTKRNQGLLVCALMFGVVLAWLALRA
jgi:hypothetical protein